MSSNDSALLLSHEERIQQSEEFRSEVAATMAQLTEQVKQVGEKVVEVGETLKEALGGLKKTNDLDHGSLRQEIADLKSVTEDHSLSLALLLSDRTTREKRIKNLRKIAMAVGLGVLGEIAIKWGDSIYNWFTSLHGK